LQQLRRSEFKSNMIQNSGNNTVFKS
jgi:hypothetical protein